MRPNKEELRKYDIPTAAKKFEVSTRTIRRWLAQEGIYNPKPGYGPGKLDKNKAAEIRRLYFVENYTQIKLAKIHGVTQAMIGRIVNNLAYKVDLRVQGSADYMIC